MRTKVPPGTPSRIPILSKTIRKKLPDPVREKIANAKKVLQNATLHSSTLPISDLDEVLACSNNVPNNVGNDTENLPPDPFRRLSVLISHRKRNNVKLPPITPRKTRSGKVFSRLSEIFKIHERMTLTLESESTSTLEQDARPVDTAFSAPEIASVPCLPVIDFSDEPMNSLTTQEEINSTIDNVPNLADVDSPVNLIDFDSSNRSLTPMEEDQISQQLRQGISLAQNALTISESDVQSEALNTPRRSTDAVQECETPRRRAFKTFRGFSAASLAFSTENDRQLQAACAGDGECSSEPAGALAPRTKMAGKSRTAMCPTPEATNTDESAPKTDAVSSECTVAERRNRRKSIYVPACARAPSSIEAESTEPQSECASGDSVIASSVNAEQSGDPDQNPPQPGNAEEEKRLRKLRRNSICPLQALKAMAAARSASPPESADAMSEAVQVEAEPPVPGPEDTSGCEASTSERPVSSESEEPEVAAPPRSKRGRLTKPKRGKATGKKSASKPSPLPKPETEDGTFVPMQVIDGKVYVSIPGPVGRRKFNRIPRTIEIDSSLLVDPPTVSCLKKPTRESWNGQKYFRWADTKAEKELTEVREFTNDFNLRQSTYRKALFETLSDD